MSAPGSRPYWDAMPIPPLTYLPEGDLVTTPQVTPLGVLNRTCRSSKQYNVGTPGTYGFGHESLLCTLPADHPGDSHLCDEGGVLSCWDSTGWRFFRTPRRTS